MPYKKSKYKHERQKPPSKFVKSSFETVPIKHATTPTGKAYKGYPKGTKAIVGRVKEKRKGQRAWQTQSILVPKTKR